MKTLFNATRWFSRLVHDNPYRSIEKTLRLNEALDQNGTYRDFLLRNKLISFSETPQQMFERSAKMLALGDPILEKDILERITRFEIVLNTAMYTNAGRHEQKSLSACAIPPVNFRKMSHEKLESMIREYHTKGMGTGFNLDSAEDPIETLKMLNAFAAKEVHHGLIERPVGNMAILSADHPCARAFASIKTDSTDIKDWRFNNSLNFSDAFMQKIVKGDPSAIDILMAISESAMETGDPGVVFMHRHEASNKVPHLGSYISLAPCGEVPLLNGEVCHFSYINLYAFVNEKGFDYEKLKAVIPTLVLLLDNAIEYGLSRLPEKESQSIVSQIRKIGIGICGFSDALMEMGIPYASEQASHFAENLMSFINYESKKASIELAKKRGAFPAFYDSATCKEKIIEPYCDKPTDMISSSMWNLLNQSLSQHGIRHISTVILPPTGRSAMLAGVSTSLEPPFKLLLDDKLKKSLQRHAFRFESEKNLVACIEKDHTLESSRLPEEIKAIYKTALLISADAHIQMTARFQKFTDEAISKTVNLPNNASKEEVASCYINAYTAGLKGMSVYVDKSREYQPKTMQVDENTYQDMIYGNLKLEEHLKKLIQAQAVQRLKDIHQNGLSYLIDPRLSTTRFEHSVGVMLLVSILRGSTQEQVAGLLHDLSHTAFSHVIDVVLNKKDQNFHEENRSQFIDDELIQLLSSIAMKSEDIQTDDVYSIVKTKAPDLCADRLDYFLRDSLALNLISRAEARSIVDHLTVHEGIIHCRDEEVAYFIFKKFIELNTQVYFNPAFEVASLAFKAIAIALLASGHLTLPDFFLTEAHVLEKIKASPLSEDFKAIQPGLDFTIANQETPFMATRKLRYFDPRILSANHQRLTEVNVQAKKQLDTYLSTQQSVYYDIPRFRFFHTTQQVNSKATSSNDLTVPCRSV